MVAPLATLLLGSYLFICLARLGSSKPGYSHLAHTISELGEWGAPHQRFVALGVFLPLGLGLLGVALAVKATSLPVAALATCIALGYLGAAAFPCDPGSPMLGSGRQALHNLAGAIEYAGGACAFMVIAEELSPVFQYAGFLVFAATIAISVLPSKGIRGLIQRVAELTLFGGLAWAAWMVSAAN